MSALFFYCVTILGVFAAVGLLRAAVWLLGCLNRLLEAVDEDEWPLGPR
jgi:HAMP domain-containing protein